MSTPQPTPAAPASPTPAPSAQPGQGQPLQGARPGQGQPGPQQGSPPGQPQPPAPGDYLGRIRSEPDFAAEEVRKKDGEITKLGTELKRYEPLRHLVEGLGGATNIQSHLTRWAKVLSHPEMARVVEEFERTGRVAASQGRGAGNGDLGDEDFDDPRVAQEMQGIKSDLNRVMQQIQQLGGQLSIGQVNQGKALIGSYLTELQGEYPDLFDQVLKPGLEAQLMDWENDPAGQQILARLSRADLDTIKAKLLLPHMEKLGEAAYLRKLREQRGMGSDAPSTILSDGQPPSEPPRHSSVREAFDAFDQEQRLGRV